MDGWERAVLRMPVCQQEMKPRRKPGRNWVVKMIASTRILCQREKEFAATVEDVQMGGKFLSSPIIASGEASASPFPRSVRRQATEMSTNLG